MTAFQILEAQETKRLPPRNEGDSELCVDHYTLSQNGTQILVTCFRRATTPIPDAGTTIEGELGEQDNFDKGRRKFKRSRQGGGGGGSNAAKDEYWRRKEQRDIEAQWRMGRSSAQKQALSYIGHKVALGKIEDFDTSDLLKLIEWFQRDLDPSPVAQSDIPGDDGGLPPTTL